MPTVDFAAAQERLAARRRARDAALQSRISAQRALHDASLSRVPYPLNRLAHAGLNIWDGIKGREGTQPAFRVGQVDAELLDEELLDLLKGQVGEALKYYGGHLSDDYSAEILLCLRAVLFKLTIWDHNASYGASLQGLRYTDARDPSLARPPPQRWQKAIYGLTTVLGRYSWSKWETHLLSLTEDYTSDPTPSQRFLSRLTTIANTSHSLTALFSFLIFLLNGQYRTLLDRILRLRLTPTSHATSREVSFEYLNRQLVWHAFTEFLLFLLPLVGISRWRRILTRAWRKLSLFFRYTLLGLSPPSSSSIYDAQAEKGEGELHFLPERTCAICHKDENPTAGAEAAGGMGGVGGLPGSATTDITNPYETKECGCIYCYVCLAQRLDAEEGEGWTCLRCGETVYTCQPWSGDVLVEEQARAGSGKGKSVGFADEAGGRRGNAHVLEDVDEGYGEEEEGESVLADVDPVPEGEEGSEEEEESYTSDVEDSTNYLSSSRALDASSGLLGDSSEWARGSSDYDSEST